MLGVLLAMALSAAPAGEQIVLYTPRTASMTPFTGALPAGEELVPVYMANGRMIALGEIVDGAIRKRTPKGSDIVVELTYKPKPPERLDAPEVVLTDASGGEHRPLRNPVSGRQSLMIFKDVPAGAATISIGGKRWRPVQRKVDLIAPFTWLEEPLVATVTSKLIVHWWTLADVASLVKQQPECAKRPLKSREPEPFSLLLLHCTNQGPDVNEPFVGLRDCTTLAKAPLPAGERKGSVELANVPAGPHHVRIVAPGLPPLWKKVDIAADDATELDFEVRWFTFFGRVTRGAKPVHAKVFDAVTDPETGEYTAVLARGPGAFTTNVEPCDGSWPYYYVPDEEPRENERFDVEIPDNRLKIEVVDGASGAGIAKTRVSLVAIKDDSENAAHFAGMGKDADDEGRVEIGPVLTKQRLRVCAEAKGYERKCSDPFRMLSLKEKQVRIALEKASERAGRIVTDVPVVRGQVAIYSPDGVMREWVRRIERDGRFALQKRHPAGMLGVFFSASHPLLVFRTPAESDPFDVRLPLAPVRQVQITLGPAYADADAFFSVMLGDVIVPLEPWNQHGLTRGVDVLLRRNVPLLSPPVYEIAPLSVVLVPISFLERASPQLDVLLLPEARSLPRVVVGDRRAVVVP